MKPDAGRGVVPAVSGNDLVEAVPGLKDLCDLDVREFSNIPSCQMSPQKMHELAHAVKSALEEDETVGVVITHGTDTVEESAFYLDTTLNTQKPVVFTAAMRDAGSPSADGPKNILCAARTALAPEARSLGVLVVLNELVHSALDVTKTHSANTDAFAAPWRGPIGYVDDDAVIIRRSPVPREHFFPDAPVGEVHLLKMTAGCDAALLDFLIEKKAAGIVIEGFGRGNVPPAVQNSMLKAVENNIPVALSSRCGAGRPAHAYGYAGGGRISHEGGVIFAGELSGPKARIFLMLVLGQTRDMREIQRYFAALPGGNRR